MSDEYGEVSGFEFRVSGFGSRIGEDCELQSAPPSTRMSAKINSKSLSFSGGDMKAKTIVLTLALYFCAAAVCYAQDVQMGTWKLNEAKSKLAAGVTKNHTVAYEAAGDNVKVTVDGTDRDGKRTLALTVKKGGKVTVTGRIVTSADGKSRTVTTRGTDPQGKKFKSTAVYDKQ